MTDIFRHFAVCLGLSLCVFGYPHAAAAQTTALLFDSQPGDYLGGGQVQVWTPGPAQFTPSVNSDRSYISINVTTADGYWYVNFGMPNRAPFAPGVYENTVRHSFSATPPPTLDVWGSGRSCGSAIGRFIVYEVTVNAAGALVQFAADFELYCNNAAAGLFGAVRLNSTRASLDPFGGAYPVYSLHVESAVNGYVTGQGINCGAGLTDCDETLPQPGSIALEAVPSAGYVFLGWAGPDCSGDDTAAISVTRRVNCLPVFNRQAASPGAESPDYSDGAFALDGVIGPGTYYGSPPATGRHVYLDLAPGALADSMIAVSYANTTEVGFRVTGPRGIEWTLELASVPGAVLSPGSYEFAVSNPTLARGQVPYLAVTGPGVNCTAGGRFVVYEITLANGVLTAFAADFEVSCSERAIRTAGSIRYRSSRESLLPFDGAYPLHKLTLVPTLGGYVVGDGLSCGDGGRTDCDQTYAEPTYVGLEAVASTGYEFIAWSSGCSSGGGVVAALYVDRLLRCYPIFSPSPASMQAGDALLGNATLLLDVPSAFPPRTILLGHDVGITMTSSNGGAQVNFAFNPPTGQVSVTFTSPGGRFAPGDYDEARWSVLPSFPGLSVSTCYGSVGRFRVYEVTYDNAGSILAFAADFEAFCGSSSVPFVAGAVRFNAARTKLLPFDGVYPAHKLKIDPAVNGVVTGAGIDCGPGRSDCTEAYASAVNVALVAIPLPGYRFVAWAGECDGSASTVIAVQWIERCEALFDPIVPGSGVVDPRVAARALFIDSQPGDQLGRNRRHAWLGGRLSAYGSSQQNSIRVYYDVPEGSWTLEFYAPPSQRLGPATFENARYPNITNRTGPGIYITGPSRYCSSGSTIVGRFVIYELTFDSNNNPTSLAVDFEHRCSPTAPALYGSIRHNSSRGQLRPFPAPQITRVIGDWNGDGTVDLVWQNRATGHLAVWLMNGTTQIDNVGLAPDQVGDTNWHIVGTADANQDGYTDLYWQHQTTGALAVWYMVEAVRAGTASLSPGAVADTAWKVRTVADLDRDGHPDLIWQHTGNGAVAVWFMNGVQMRSGDPLGYGRVDDLGWKIVGAGDANGDGAPDLFWHHASSGDLAVWFMNGSTSTGGQALSPGRVPDPAWQVRGVRDMDGNGSADVIWQNTTTFQTSVWLLNGVIMIDGRLVAGPALPSADWHLVSPK